MSMKKTKSDIFVIFLGGHLSQYSIGDGGMVTHAQNILKRLDGFDEDCPDNRL